MGQRKKGVEGGWIEGEGRRRDGGRFDMTNTVCCPNAWETLKLPHKMG